MATDGRKLSILHVAAILLLFLHSDHVLGRSRIRAADKRSAFCGLNTGRAISRRQNISEDSSEEEGTGSGSGSEGDEGRIVGGRVAKDHEVPYLVSVRKTVGLTTLPIHHHTCGGAIYSERWIITGAHCFKGRDRFEKFDIAAGEHHLEFPEESEQIIGIKRIIDHPFYDADDNNDITLLELEKPLKFSQYVRPIRIPPCNYVLKGRAKISGWGHQEAVAIGVKGDVLAHELQVAEVNVYPPKQCQQILSRGIEARSKTSKLELHENAFCAGHVNKSIDTCQGDSGGPLACHGPDGDTLCGVSSYGFGCALHGLPGVYTNVAHFHDWITYVTSSTPR